MATYPNAIVRYYATGMILHVHSDASYLSENGDRSRAGGFLRVFATPKISNSPHLPTSSPPHLNGAIHIISTLIKNVFVLDVHWRPGIENLADYFTNNFSPVYHHRIRDTYILSLHKLRNPQEPPG